MVQSPIVAVRNDMCVFSTITKLIEAVRRVNPVVFTKGTK